jgi:hypothetical protein
MNKKEKAKENKCGTKATTSKKEKRQIRKRKQNEEEGNE